MAQPLNDAALDQLFRTARTFNGYLDTPVTTAQTITFASPGNQTWGTTPAALSAAMSMTVSAPASASNTTVVLERKVRSPAAPDPSVTSRLIW